MLESNIETIGKTTNPNMRTLCGETIAIQIEIF